MCRQKLLLMRPFLLPPLLLLLFLLLLTEMNYIEGSLLFLHLLLLWAFESCLSAGPIVAWKVNHGRRRGNHKADRWKKNFNPPKFLWEMAVKTLSTLNTKNLWKKMKKDYRRMVVLVVLIPKRRSKSAWFWPPRHLRPPTSSRAPHPSVRGSPFGSSCRAVRAVAALRLSPESKKPSLTWRRRLGWRDFGRFRWLGEVFEAKLCHFHFPDEFFLFESWQIHSFWCLGSSRLSILWFFNYPALPCFVGWIFDPTQTAQIPRVLRHDYGLDFEERSNEHVWVSKGFAPSCLVFFGNPMVVADLGQRFSESSKLQRLGADCVLGLGRVAKFEASHQWTLRIAATWRKTPTETDILGVGGWFFIAWVGGFYSLGLLKDFFERLFIATSRGMPGWRQRAGFPTRP